MNTNSEYSLGIPIECEIKDDILYRHEYFTNDIVKRIPVISKEEFLICYKTWVNAESEE